ncbi:MAG: CsgG/HfaB family protein, partial [Desulfobacterales bacterium]|nr:CsgG/HfaB family protein [Desulfobacterales bacterium]
LAVLPFENNSITDPERYAPLGRGLAAMLITDLKNAGTSLRLIERSKIAALLKEIALSQSGSVDEATAVRAGRLLGAQSISFGSFVVLGDAVRIDTRIVKVETGELIMAESIEGGSDAFIGLERQLAQKIAASLKVALSPGGAGKSSMEAALFFSQGLDALDRGDKAKARQLFQQAIQADPSYKAQVANVQGLN